MEHENDHDHTHDHARELAHGVFDDLMAGNAEFVEEFTFAGLAASPSKELAVVTCMDCRVMPSRMLRLHPGDAQIIRTAGARVTDDVLRSLVLGVNVLGVTRIAVIVHTDCAMCSVTDEQLHDILASRYGDDPADHFWPQAIEDQVITLIDDIERLAEHPLMPDDVIIGGLRYDVETGALAHIVDVHRTALTDGSQAT